MTGPIAHHWTGQDLSADIQRCLVQYRSPNVSESQLATIRSNLVNVIDDHQGQKPYEIVAVLKARLNQVLGDDANFWHVEVETEYPGLMFYHLVRFVSFLKLACMKCQVGKYTVRVWQTPHAWSYERGWECCGSGRLLNDAQAANDKALLTQLRTQKHVEDGKALEGPQGIALSQLQVTSNYKRAIYAS